MVEYLLTLSLAGGAGFSVLLDRVWETLSNPLGLLALLVLCLGLRILLLPPRVR